MWTCDLGGPVRRPWRALRQLAGIVERQGDVEVVAYDLDRDDARIWLSGEQVRAARLVRSWKGAMVQAGTARPFDRCTTMHPTRAMHTEVQTSAGRVPLWTSERDALGLRHAPWSHLVRRVGHVVLHQPKSWAPLTVEQCAEVASAVLGWPVGDRRMTRTAAHLAMDYDHSIADLCEGLGVTRRRLRQIRHEEPEHLETARLVARLPWLWPWGRT